MNTLFTAMLIVHGRPTAYDVTFTNDRYFFHDEANAEPSLTVYRENDEWKAEGSLDDVSKQQAVSQLENYLLQQH